MAVQIEYVFGRDTVGIEGFSISEKRGPRLSEVLRIGPSFQNKTPEGRALVEDMCNCVVLLLNSGLNAYELAGLISDHDRRSEA